MRKPHAPSCFRYDVRIEGRYAQNGGTPKEEFPVQNSWVDLLDTGTKAWLVQNWVRRRADFEGGSDCLDVGEETSRQQAGEDRKEDAEWVPGKGW